MMSALRQLALSAAMLSMIALGACSSDEPDTNDPPSGLAASATSQTAVHVTWTAGTGATGYVLQRATGAAGAFAEINRPASTATSYDDAGLTANTQYRYRIAAIRAAGTSEFSTAASV